jgi:hypothetical protein
MFDDEVLVLESYPVNRLSTCSIEISNVSALNYELIEGTLDHTP